LNFDQEDPELKTHGITHLLSRVRKDVRGIWSDEAAYSINIKYDTICELLDEDENEHILYLDADTIVRSDLSPLIEQVGVNSMGLFDFTKYGNDDEARNNQWSSEFNSPGRTLGASTGLMFIKNNEATREFFANVYAEMKDNMDDPDAEVVPFERHYTRMIEDGSITRVKLSRKFKDEGPVFSDDSIIWSGRGAEKLMNTQYLNEVEKYKIYTH